MCQKAAPSLNKLFVAIKEDSSLNSDIRVFGVAVGDELKQITAFKKQFRVFFPVVPDTDGDVYGDLGIPGVPFTVVTNKEGKVLMTHSGVIEDLDKMLKEIRELHKQQ